MTRTILAVLLAALTGAAVASGNSNSNNSNNGGTATATATVGNINVNGGTHTQTTTNNITVKPDITNVNVNGQEQKQGQAQDQMQGQMQGQIATGGDASNKGNTQRTEIKMEIKDRLQPGSVAVAATTTTASCRVAIQGGVSFPGGGVGFGSAYLDEKCDMRALGLAYIDAARVAGALGADPEYFAMLFERGVALLAASAQDAPAEKKTVGKSMTGGEAGSTINP